MRVVIVLINEHDDDDDDEGFTFQETDQREQLTERSRQFCSFPVQRLQVQSHGIAVSTLRRRRPCCGHVPATVVTMKTVRAVGRHDRCPPRSKSCAATVSVTRWIWIVELPTVRISRRRESTSLTVPRRLPKQSTARCSTSF